MAVRCPLSAPRPMTPAAILASSQTPAVDRPMVAAVDRRGGAMSHAEVLALASELWALIEGGDADGAWSLVAPAVRTDAGLEALGLS